MRWAKFKLVLTGLIYGLVVSIAPAEARETAPQGAVQTVRKADLPAQGVETYDKILQGGPFPYDKDGVIFGNRERILPANKRGYYREYTVKTPYARNRGARRIVCGGPATQPDACFYTADHYESFRKIVP